MDDGGRYATATAKYKMWHTGRKQVIIVWGHWDLVLYKEVGVRNAHGVYTKGYGLGLPERGLMLPHRGVLDLLGVVEVLVGMEEGSLCLFPSLWV